MFTPSITLDKKQIEYINSFKHIFRNVQDKTGVPWQAVAAIWTRESFSVAPPRTPGGPFQFDPPLDIEVIGKLLHRFSTLTAEEIAKLAKKGINDFETAAFCCACWLRLNTKNVLTPKSSDEDIKDALYGYNGRAYGSSDDSPYVMNGYDATHKDMHLHGSIPDGHGGRKWVNIEDHRPGAFTVYCQLKAK